MGNNIIFKSLGQILMGTLLTTQIGTHGPSLDDENNLRL